jgi:hypothetical protein
MKTQTVPRAKNLSLNKICKLSVINYATPLNCKFSECMGVLKNSLQSSYSENCDLAVVEGSIVSAFEAHPDFFYKHEYFLEFIKSFSVSHKIPILLGNVFNPVLHSKSTLFFSGNKTQNVKIFTMNFCNVEPELNIQFEQFLSEESWAHATKLISRRAQENNTFELLICQQGIDFFSQEIPFYSRTFLATPNFPPFHEDGCWYDGMLNFSGVEFISLPLSLLD